MYDKELGLIGVGNMGTALLKGVLSSNTIEKEKTVIYDVREEVIKNRIQEFNVKAVGSNTELVQQVKFIIIAVKPQNIDSVLEEIGPKLSEDQILISIAAGVTLDYIKKFISKNIGLVRVMPNTPALVGEGASAIAYNNNVTENDLKYVKKVLNSVGKVVELEEKHIDAVTGLSGSGPAYVFIIIEALADGGVKMGLPRNIALKLAAQTVLGAAKMVIETGMHPGELKDMVASPGGTTITALHEIEKGKLRATLISAVEAATLKSKSLK
ncbi:MAG: pyrroline-5-carboxylate reductase [Promethearchaeota archaeon]